MSQYPHIQASILRFESHWPAEDEDLETTMLKLSTEANGVLYSHLVAMPPLSHQFQFPESGERAINSALDALHERVQHGDPADNA